MKTSKCLLHLSHTSSSLQSLLSPWTSFRSHDNTSICVRTQSPSQHRLLRLLLLVLVMHLRTTRLPCRGEYVKPNSKLKSSQTHLPIWNRKNASPAIRMKPLRIHLWMMPQSPWTHFSLTSFFGHNTLTSFLGALYTLPQPRSPEACRPKARCAAKAKAKAGEAKKEKAEKTTKKAQATAKAKAKSTPKKRKEKKHKAKCAATQGKAKCAAKPKAKSRARKETKRELKMDWNNVYSRKYHACKRAGCSPTEARVLTLIHWYSYSPHGDSFSNMLFTTQHHQAASLARSAVKMLQSDRLAESNESV